MYIFRSWSSQPSQMFRRLFRRQGICNHPDESPMSRCITRIILRNIHAGLQSLNKKSPTNTGDQPIGTCIFVKAWLIFHIDNAVWSFISLSAVPCPAGFYFADSQCHLCPKKTYQPEVQALECLPCPTAKEKGLRDCPPANNFFDAIIEAAENVVRNVTGAINNMFHIWWY